MKPFGYILIAVISVLSFHSLHSQNINNPWTTSFGPNAINNPLRDQEAGLGRFKTWNLNAAGFKLSAGRLIKNRLSFDVVASLNSIE